jgi:hypothetical protein
LIFRFVVNRLRRRRIEVAHHRIDQTTRDRDQK